MSENEKRVLVIEDDDAIRALLSGVLRRRGFKVDACRNGAEGVDHARRCHYAVVLLSLTLQGGDSDAVIEEIANRGVDTRPLLFVMSGATPRHLPPELVTGTIRKPFEIQLVVDSVAACMGALSDRPQIEGCPSADDDAVIASSRDKLTN